MLFPNGFGVYVLIHLSLLNILISKKYPDEFFISLRP
jgi:hypothetical protein